MRHFDVAIVGGSFSGLAAALELRRLGLSVAVIERKRDVGLGLNTTGILVKEALAEYQFPEKYLRKIREVRLHAPNRKHIDLQHPDYFFCATDTPNLLRHMVQQVIDAGAEVMLDSAFASAETGAGGKIILPQHGIEADYLIGADGPRSRVAEFFNLGRNKKFLLGAEVEYKNIYHANLNRFDCYLSQKFAYGYLGWMVPGFDGITQIGLAVAGDKKPELEKLFAILPDECKPPKAELHARRGGLIPCGGLVAPLYRGNVILLGDAAGMVSPLTAGGIFTALHYGKSLARAISAHKSGAGMHPGAWAEKHYPRFYKKRLLRFIYEKFAPDWALSLALPLLPFHAAAKKIFFK